VDQHITVHKHHAKDGVSDSGANMHELTLYFSIQNKNQIERSTNLRLVVPDTDSSRV